MATVWKTYRGGPTKPAGGSTYVSINSKHNISFNRRAWKLLNEAEAVVLLFDDKNSVIGMVASNLRNPEAFPVKAKNALNWVVYASPFCRHFRIMVDETERFDDPEVDEEGILRLDLKRTHNVSLLKRGR